MHQPWCMNCEAPTNITAVGKQIFICNNCGVAIMKNSSQPYDSRRDKAYTGGRFGAILREHGSTI